HCPKRDSVEVNADKLTGGTSQRVGSSLCIRRKPDYVTGSCVSLGAARAAGAYEPDWGVLRACRPRARRSLIETVVCDRPGITTVVHHNTAAGSRRAKEVENVIVVDYDAAVANGGG